ncbi:hypothetical protein TNCV_3945321 [Trichonephila clavipes]|nr:hypothetical protein TNCV_3945321 [Trichonephila clavipes]
MQPLGVGGVDVRDFGVKNCYESSGRDWSARSAPIGGEKVCQKRMVSCLDRHVVSSLSVHGSLNIDEAVGVCVNLFVECSG